MPLNTNPLGDETRAELRARLATRKTVQAAARQVALTRLYAALERAVVAGQITGHDARDTPAIRRRLRLSTGLSFHETAESGPRHEHQAEWSGLLKALQTNADAVLG